MRREYFVIKLLNPRDLATVGYWRRGCYTPRLYNVDATRFDSAADARGVAMAVTFDRDFDLFMAGWRVKPLLQIIRVKA